MFAGLNIGMNFNGKKRTRLVSGGIIRFFALIYFVLGILKLHGILSPQEVMIEYLRLPNPIFSFLTNEMVLGFASALELFTGGYVLFSKNTNLFRSSMLLWLACITLFYKASLVVVHYKGPCGCLLGISRLLPISVSLQRSLSDLFLILSTFCLTAIVLYSKLSGAEKRNDAAL